MSFAFNNCSTSVIALNECIYVASKWFAIKKLTNRALENNSQVKVNYLQVLLETCRAVS